MGQNEQFLQSQGDVDQSLFSILSKATQEAQTPQELHLAAKAYASVGFQSSAMALRSKIGDAVKALDRENGAVDVVERVAHLSAAMGLLD
jgi:hypothetical protein